LRKLSILISFILLTSPLAITKANAATPKLGGTCSKVGSFGDTPKERFICVKSGKKLVWGVWKNPNSNNNSASKGSATPTPAPVTTPTPAEAVFKAPIPITLPAAQGQITFANITDHLTDIPTAAYNNYEASISASALPTIPYDIFISSDIAGSISKSHVSALIDRSLKLFAGFQAPTYFAVYIYDYKGISWAENKYEENAQTRKYSLIKNYNDRFAHDVDGTCNSQNCGGTSAGMIRGSNEGYMAIAVDSGGDPEGFLSSPNVPHSFIHLIQKSQWDGTQIDDVNRYQNSVMPFWFFEGVSQGPALIFTKSLQSYLESRKWVLYRLGGTGLKNLSAQAMTNYLLSGSSTKTIDVNGNQIAGDGGPGSVMGNLGNPIGGLAVEALAAIAGPQSLMALTALVANGSSMEDSFLKVYGVSWIQGTQVLGQVIAAELKQNPPTP